MWILLAVLSSPSLAATPDPVRCASDSGVLLVGKYGWTWAVEGNYPLTEPEHSLERKRRTDGSEAWTERIEIRRVNERGRRGRVVRTDARCEPLTTEVTESPYGSIIPADLRSGERRCVSADGRVRVAITWYTGGEWQPPEMIEAQSGFIWSVDGERLPAERVRAEEVSSSWSLSIGHATSYEVTTQRFHVRPPEGVVWPDDLPDLSAIELECEEISEPPQP